jgi:hypothetical protein
MTMENIKIKEIMERGTQIIQVITLGKKWG